ncbi:AAA family ATPase [Frisingicoccus sp.]|uniref:cytidylate kinase-like family protein n=1 Tax=Frisingicoccus sp. TaxID=1918627 RepID=UPI003AB8E94E
MSGNYIITIGREYGSGGLEIGQKLAEKLGIKCYDKELINLVAEKKGFKKEILEKADEKRGSSFIEPSGGFFPGRPSKTLPAFGAFGKTINDKVFLMESSVIHSLAREESCVIIGRCADVLLKDRDNVLTVFIQAPKDARIKRLAEQFQLSEEMAEKEVRRIDKIRSSYYQFYTDRKWGGRDNFDLVINSAALGIDNTVNLIKIAAEHKFS